MNRLRKGIANKKDRMRSTRWTIMAAVIGVLVSCATLPENVQRKASTAYPDTHDTRIGQRVQTEMQMHPGESGYLLLGNGLDAFVARVLLAQQAERSIDTQYYMIHDDVVGSLFVDQLYKAAERGVRVRLLVDDIDQEGRDAGAVILDGHPNIEVRIFNPFARNVGRIRQYVSGFGKQTRRAHYSELFAILDRFEDKVSVSVQECVDDSIFRGEVQVLKSFQFYSTARGELSAITARDTLNCFPSEYHSVRGFALMVQSAAIQMQGGPEQARRVVVEALQQEAPHIAPIRLAGDSHANRTGRGAHCGSGLDSSCRKRCVG